MSSQASVRSIDALKELRVAMALYGEDTLGAIGAVEAEVRRTVRWLMEERPVYWQEQIKRRREQVSTARAEVFKKNLQKRPDYSPPMSEQKENLRKAEASLQDAEKRYAAVKKWQPLFKHAVLEYHASVQRIKDLTAGDMPRAVNLLSRMIDSLEAYLRVTAPSGLETLSSSGAGAGTSMAIPTTQVDTVAVQALDEAEAAAALEAQAKAKSQDSPDAPADVPIDETGGDSLEPISHSNDEGVDA
jgi:hypothetical protein